MRLRGLLALAVACAVLAPADALAENPKLSGTVGPGFTIKLSDAAGNPVTHVDAGTYDIVIDDRSEDHNFHLSGPGVDRFTEVDFVGTVTWTVTFTDALYRFNCDPHPLTMRGSFTVGTFTTPPPPPAPTKLTATVSATGAITLRDASGAAVHHGLRAGAYAITVRDRSKRHNLHASGAGVNRKTGLAQVATVTWKVTLKAGKLVLYSDARPAKRLSLAVTA